MTDPVSFTSASPRFGLPLLFAGQAQKEFYVNEAVALADMLLHPAIEGESNIPPVSPVAGEAWLVGNQPTGAWTGHAGALACLEGGTWLFAEPRPGLRLYEKATSQDLRFDGSWRRALPVSTPNGGTVVDSEARQAIADLIAALAEAGVVASI